MIDRPAMRIVNAEAPVFLSPSGLPVRYLVGAEVGARELFVAQQSLQPGECVLLHTHPTEEVLFFLSGSGEARLDADVVPVGAGVTLFIPPGVPHGFRNTGPTPLQVLVVFPGSAFAETTLLDPKSALAKPE